MNIPYVSAIFERTIQFAVVAVRTPPLVFEGLLIGSIKGSARPYSSQEELAVILSEMQANNIPFGDEPAGWPPAAVFQHLRDKGLVKGSIYTVCWTAPHTPIFGAA